MGYFKRPVGPLHKNAPNLFTIMGVNSKLVDAKNLNKYLKKITRRRFKKQEFTYLLSYTLKYMPQSIDDVNLVSILVLISKFGINDKLLLKSIVPFLYKLNDFDKISDCLLYSSMLFGEDDNLKVYASRLIYDLPSYINSINYNNISKICESLCYLNLYSQQFGDLISTLICKDTLSSGQVGLLNFSSILNYISRVGTGDANIWRLYANFSLRNLLSANYKPVLKLLQSFYNSNIHHKSLFRSCGEYLTKYIRVLHPIDVSNLSYIYFKMNHRHEPLFNEILKVGERISTNLNGISSLKLLSGYYFYFSHPSSNFLLPSSNSLNLNPLSQNYFHCLRTVYLLYNNISKDLNILQFEDFLLLFKTLELFKFINVANLQSNLFTFLNHNNMVNSKPLSNLESLKVRFREKRLINSSQESFIKLLMS